MVGDSFLARSPVLHHEPWVELGVGSPAPRRLLIQGAVNDVIAILHECPPFHPRLPYGWVGGLVVAAHHLLHLALANRLCLQR